MLTGSVFMYGLPPIAVRIW